MITLPWPDMRLNPNARVHWRPLAVVKADAKDAAFWQTKAAIQMADRAHIIAGEGRIPMTITFYPPDARHRDDDNMVASFKAARDGIAAALGCDDRRFRPHYVFADPCKPGRIEVKFSPVIDVLPCANSAVGADGVVGRERAAECANTLTALTFNVLSERNV